MNTNSYRFDKALRGLHTALCDAYIHNTFNQYCKLRWKCWLARETVIWQHMV